jgi:ketosteroid isomerase-like protein
VSDDLGETIERYHRAADEFSRGDPRFVKDLFSHRDDVTLANPFGPAVRGWAAVSDALDFASSRFRDGRVSFEALSIYKGVDLASMHEVEHWQAKVGDKDVVATFVLRVSTTVRLEDNEWKIVHRHADPIATPDVRGPLRGA